MFEERRGIANFQGKAGNHTSLYTKWEEMKAYSQSPTEVHRESLFFSNPSVVFTLPLVNL